MRIIDLSHEISPDMPSHPPMPQQVLINRHEDDRSPNPWNYPPGTGAGTEGTSLPFTRTMGLWIGLEEHHGAHVDAPFHFNPKGKRINEMPLEIFIANAIVLDLTRKESEEKITAADLETALVKTGETLEPGQAVLMYTGQDKLAYGDYDITGKPQNTKQLQQHSGMSEDAVRWLINKKIKIFGSDTTFVDWPLNGPVHVKLLGKHGITHAEQLCNLGEIKETRVLFIALPLKLRGGTGSPVRAIAIEGVDPKVFKEFEHQYSGLHEK